MPAFERVQKNQDVRPYVVEWNAMLDLVSKSSIGASDSKAKALERATTKVQVRPNVSVGRFGIVGLAGPAISPTANLLSFQERFVFDAQLPSNTTHGNSWAIMAEPAVSGNIKVAYSGGIAPVQIDVIHEQHGYARISDGDSTQLESDHRGSARIAWKEAGTGTKWALVDFHHRDAHELLCVANADIAAGSNGLCKVQGFAGTGSDIDVHLDWMHGGQKISGTKQVLARWFDSERKWRAVGADCEESP